MCIITVQADTLIDINSIINGILVVFFSPHAESPGGSAPFCGQIWARGHCLVFRISWHPLWSSLFLKLKKKKKKCSQCGHKRGRWRSKLVIHDAFMKGWQNTTAYKLTQAAVINPRSPLRARKTNSAAKMKRLIIRFRLPSPPRCQRISFIVTPYWVYVVVGHWTCFVWSFVTFFSLPLMQLVRPRLPSEVRSPENSKQIH